MTDPTTTAAPSAIAEPAPVQAPVWLKTIEAHASIDQLVERLRAARDAWALPHGGTGSAPTVVVAALAHRLTRPILYVVAHLDEADDAADELRDLGLAAHRFPALEALPGETGVSPELLGERLAMVRRLIDGDAPAVIVAPIAALMQSIPLPKRLDELVLRLDVGDTRGPGAILSWLGEAGYQRVESIESPGEFAVRGGLIDVYPVAGGTEGDEDAVPVRLDFFGDELEHIAAIDLDTMASDRRLRSAQLVGARAEQLLTDEDTTGLWTVLPADAVVVLRELMEVTEQGRGYYERAVTGSGIYGPPAVLKALRDRPYLQIDQHPISATDPDATVELPFDALPAFAQDANEAVKELVELTASGRVVVACSNAGERERLGELLSSQPEAGVESAVMYLHRGFVWNPGGDADRVHVVPYHELLHRYHTRRQIRRLRGGRAMDTFLDLTPGDYVVHRDHGIARFVELRTMDLKGEGKDGATQEYLTLEFAGGSKLHVPATRIELVQKYVGGYDGRPPLSTLGGRKWEHQKEKVREAVKDLAGEMLRLQAARTHLPGIRYPHDTEWQRKFEAEFPYQETEDQLAALAEIKKDMNDERPMDRLLCGDVGFGKTEVAMRAAFKAVEYGKQVAVLVPTTVLAEQHYRTFKARFADYPFRVEVISRFQTGQTAKRILEGVRSGAVDVIIGTHRLLSNDVRFADLGLVIIDEEQRFGVEHKQRLLQFRMTADVLTLSATPIPRTLHMSLLGLRDISSLTTPPLDRRAIVTEVVPYNPKRIKQAIERELAREGQVYFVHNRVHDIRSVADDVQTLVPDARIIVGHGQMAGRELEKVMLKFVRHQADVLVCTTIIESGIDIPNVNTMFIHDAHRFGLAELHQLRGRVGRYKHRAYCYLLLPEEAISTVAAKRLKAIEEYSMLGAGFKIAMRDLELRGAGNLLGPEQSGHIAAVGYEMYCHLLEQAVAGLKNEPLVQPEETDVELGIAGSITRAYIPSDQRRLEAYRRISQARTPEELARVEHDLIDAYGEPPAATRTLIELADVRISAAMLGVRSITIHEQDVIFRTPEPNNIVLALKGAKGSVRVLEDRHDPALREVYFRPPGSYLEPATLVPFLRRRLGKVAERAAGAAMPAETPAS